MSIVYLLPTLPPKSAKAEAIAQEIELLRRHFPGEVVHVNPNIGLPRPLIPRLGFGWHSLPTIFKLAQQATLFHFFNPDPFPYPFLLTLPRPVVYTITAGVTSRPNLAFFRRMAVVTVPDERTLAQLQGWGLTNAALQRPGIATERFTHTPLPLPPAEPLRLLVASAPWTLAQFSSKGFDALLAAAQSLPDLHLTLLWRGILADEMRRRVARLGLSERVTVVDQAVDVNAALARVHAAAIFATHAGIIKSYPHSLLDALAAGKPVLLNRVIPMADYIAREGCGVVAESVTPAAIVTALTQLRANYATYARAATMIGQRDFTEDAAINAATTIYVAARQKARP
ncbi:MAG: glycosyltransferase [Caldilineaceae bacterium]|nr:glycosyltransferase [Caldilineaceae bacterium]